MNVNGQTCLFRDMRALVQVSTSKKRNQINFQVVILFVGVASDSIEFVDLRKA